MLYRIPQDKAPGGGDDEQALFDRSGDVNSIPHDDVPHPEDHAEQNWARGQPAVHIPVVADENDVSNSPCELDLIPCDENEPEREWNRPPTEKIPGVQGGEDVVNRPGDVNSIPQDGKPQRTRITLKSSGLAWLLLMFWESRTLMMNLPPHQEM